MISPLYPESQSVNVQHIVVSILPQLFAFPIPHELHLHEILDKKPNRALRTGPPMMKMPAADHIRRRLRLAVSCHSKEDKECSGRQSSPLKETDVSQKLGRGGDLGALCEPLAASTEKAAAEHAVGVTPFKDPSGEHVSAQHSRLVPFPPSVIASREDGDLHPYHLQNLPMSKPGTLSIRANSRIRRHLMQASC